MPLTQSPHSNAQCVLILSVQSQIVVMAMEILLSWFVLVVLFSVDAAQPRKHSQGIMFIT